ncbi:MAG: nuclear transport factor 2 family protein [Candidatus Electrothrix sp. Rat3]|nr:nuclear transport factor 2 family protein [Candidatus Electrothrix rattekaaiensis]
MLKNISKIATKPSPAKPLAKKTPVIVKEQSTETHVPASSKTDVTPQAIELEQLPRPTNKISELTSQQILQDEVAVVPLTPASINHAEPPAPDMKIEDEVEKLSRSISFSESQFGEEKSSTTQESDQMAPRSIVPLEKHNDLFSDILEQEKTAEEKIKATPPGAAQQTSKQKETSSLFSQARYQKAVIIKPKKKKKKSALTANNDQKHQGLSTQDSLRQFVKNYTTAYMSRDIGKFARFFTKGALENGKPFSEMREKYKQLFNTTQSIDYRIDILNTDVQKEGDTVTLTGRLHVQLIYNPDKIKSNTGTLTFFLVKDNKSYKVKAITYTIDPQW